MLRIAINGYGRIGRAVLRALFERNLENQIRSAFGFKGTPLKFIIRERSEKDMGQ